MGFLTSYDVPAISDHAYARAEERLGFTREVFKQWVKLTWLDWVEVNPTYLWERGVNCGNGDGTMLMTCPITPKKSAAMPLSADHCIKTVMTFEDLKPISVEKLNVQAGSSHTITRMLIQVLADGDTEERLVFDMATRILATKNLGGPELDRAIGLYLEGILSLKGLRSVAGAATADRDKVLERAVVRHGKGRMAA